MPEGSSLARTDAVIRKMSEIGMNTEGSIMRSLSRA
jgi:multidrug efflux pump